MKIIAVDKIVPELYSQVNVFFDYVKIRQLKWQIKDGAIVRGKMPKNDTFIL